MFDMPLADGIDAARLLENYDEWTAFWHTGPYSSASVRSFASAIEYLHRANFELWHEEDKARDTAMGDAGIATAKHTIDQINQRRNDLIELCDSLLLEELARENLPNPQAELHSETPGMILDRLSILSLKRYHTLEEVERRNAPVGHAARNRERLAILEAQRNDLAECLDRLWRKVLRGELRFRLYRQLKMYNDPNLNPVLYRPAQ